MKRYDALAIPLAGTSLIEAAAGTGKTHAIEELFLRLVLEAEMPVEQIVVVTFTRAATAELRERIYRRAAEWAAWLAAGGGGEGKDPLFARLLPRLGDPRRAAQRMRQALIDFDRAVILTIHGFCQRLLYEHAFETASGFRFEIVTDAAPLMREIVEDFWRTAICNQPPEFLAALRPAWTTPAGWLALLGRCQAPDLEIFPPQETAALRPESLEAYRAARARLRELWPQATPRIRELLAKAPLNATQYGREGRPGPGSREARLEPLLQALTAFLEEESPAGVPPGGLKKLAASQLRAATRKGAAPPRHDVFDRCEELFRSWERLEEELKAELRRLKRDFIAFIRDEAARRKARRGMLTFDDLLRKTAEALEGPGGGEFARLASSRYRAALVDEFQDTDGLQYRILSRLFGAPPQLLVLIGDPKQAIYGFRGADLFSYLQAARRVPAAFTLGDNHRSRAPLVRAVNTLFQRVPAPFVFEEIAYRPVRAARGEGGGGAGLVIWYLDSREGREDGKPLDEASARDVAGRAVCREILRLTAPPEPAYTPGDIAVLVRTNAQARFMKRLLAARRIPAVVYGTADVFAADEARELYFVLAAIARPADPTRLKTALATRMLGLSAAAIAALEGAPAAWQARQERHGEYLRIWRSRGFAVALRGFIREERVKERLLRLPDGERRLTDLLHLVEIVHGAAVEETLGPEEVLAWLAARIASPAEAGAGEHPLRLESDARAVQIVTLHRSKGLAYPVVFLPFAGSASSAEEGDFLFHDPARDYRPTLDVSGEKETPNRVQARNEALAENLRLLYVALTRARDRCYLAWGRTRNAQSSALAWLLRSAEGDAADEGDRVKRLSEEHRTLDDEALRARLAGLAAASGGTIALEEPPQDEPGLLQRPPGPDATLSFRRFAGTIDESWGVTSYSSLIAARRDVEDPLGEAAPAVPVLQNEVAAGGEAPLADFPAGARSGIFFHKILETAAPGGADLNERVRGALSEHGVEPLWADSVADLLRKLERFPLFLDPQAVCLAEVEQTRRAHEMDFTLPLRRITPGVLEGLFREAAAGPAAAQAEQAIGRLRFSPVRGFLRGVIDLVFEHRGRFYLVDWKSNRLGMRFQDYREEALAAAMTGHLYVLQYYLYVLALHRLLALRVPGYRYERHFGGVAYVFLRGIRGEDDPTTGIFRDRPEPELIHRWEEALLEPPA